jgi:hypothetical protein
MMQQQHAACMDMDCIFALSIEQMQQLLWLLS